MSFFTRVEGEAAILISSGVFTQVDLYTRDGYLFAKHGAGFIRIMADGATTKPNVRLDFMSWNGPLARCPLGRLCDPSVPGSRPLDAAGETKLLGAGR